MWKFGGRITLHAFTWSASTSFSASKEAFSPSVENTNNEFGFVLDTLAFGAWRKDLISPAEASGSLCSLSCKIGTIKMTFIIIPPALKGIRINHNRVFCCVFFFAVIQHPKGHKLTFIKMVEIIERREEEAFSGLKSHLPSSFFSFCPFSFFHPHCQMMNYQTKRKNPTKTGGLTEMTIIGFFCKICW